MSELMQKLKYRLDLDEDESDDAVLYEVEDLISDRTHYKNMAMKLAKGVPVLRDSGDFLLELMEVEHARTIRALRDRIKELEQEIGDKK